MQAASLSSLRPLRTVARPIGYSRIYVGEDTGHWLEEVAGLHSRRALRLKRGFDVVGAALLLVLAAPVLLVVALVVRLTSSGPVLFAQRRVGLHGREFCMYKFRTMVDGAEALQNRLARAQVGRTFLKLEDDPRITPSGRFLRRFSLDELPQFVNVLMGDMSLVGPRPVLPCDFDKFPKQDQLRRFSMPPGITGLWQVSGRSACSDEKRITLDLRYADGWCPILDLAILVWTIPVVLSGRDAS